LSPDGRFLAKGVPGHLVVYEVETGDQVIQFEVDFPHCAYGFDQYFQFNHNGAFIAVVTKSSIQVLQTNGGLIYENPHTRSFGDGYPSCGYDVPQIALSPDGKLLAVTGINYSKAEPTRYFRVVDVIGNEILYEWNGGKDSPHGDLSGFFGLGFSDDGQFIQTLDPKRFILADGELHQAFRFWSIKTWEEATTTDVIRASFDKGELLFPLSNFEQMDIMDKLTGEIKAQIPVLGCVWDMPCETAFSKDGTKAILLPHIKPKVQLGGHLFFQEIEILDLEKEVVIRRVPGFYRNLDGLHVSDSGELTNMQTIDTYLADGQSWWVTADLFQGMHTNQEGEIAFVPNWVGSHTLSECLFCNTCFFQIESSEINCRSGIEGSHGWYSIQSIDSEYWLIKHNPSGDGPVGKLSLQPPGDPKSQRMRLSGYSEDHKTAFYCLDLDFRPQKCVIDDLGSGRLVEEFQNVSFLRMSPEGKFIAFVDSSRNTLYIFDLDSQKLSRKSHYQARAAITNPVFSKDGRTLYYLVENLKNKNVFSVEVLDVIDQKVIHRFSLGAEIYLPIAMALNKSEDLLAVANSDGKFVLFSMGQPNTTFGFQASQNRLIGIGFGPNDRFIVALDNLGNLYLWGIE
jgi:WD40 repeat protein